MIQVPSGLTAQPRTPRVCPCRVKRSVPVRASHTLSVLSLEAETIQVPSGLTAQLFTQCVCPLRVRHSVPRCAFHTLSILSLEAETIQVPSGLTAQLFTQSVCPNGTWNVSASNDRILKVWNAQRGTECL